MRNTVGIFGAATILGICTYLGYEVLRMNRLIDAGASISLSTEKFEKTINGKNEILVLGDSLAYGVGASSAEKSFAAVLADNFSNKSIENNAEIGETISSLQKTLDQKLTTRYEHIYIIVGGNDIMRIHINVFSSARSLKAVIRDISRRAERVTLITTGDFDYVSLSPWMMRGIFNARAKIIRSAALDLESEVSNLNYVDLYKTRVDKSEYKRLEASDGYHVNDAGIQKLVSIMLQEQE